ncbi:MAG: RagB/SusD family nutrient uptake outer membrane protein [Bacteroidota bacterium]
MKKTLKYLALAVSVLAITTTVSCNKDEFLENVNKSKLNDQTMWDSENNADIFLNDVYFTMPSSYNRFDYLDYYTDDYNISHYYDASNWRQGNCLAPAFSTSNEWFDNHGPTEGYDWLQLYRKIRKANTFIQKIEEYKDNYSEEWYNKRMDEARFMRAFFYYKGFIHYGGLPIITVPLDRATMTEEELAVPRSTFEETFNFITSELGEIVDNGDMPAKYDTGDPEAGHATIGAALALKGWVELFAASELFNSGVPYLSDPDNFVHFKIANSNLWAEAAATNKKFIDELGGTYALFGDLEGLWKVENEYNSEIIWDRQHLADVSYEMGGEYNVRGGTPFIHGVYYTFGNFNPTQEVVDCFLMANGKKITDPTSGYDPQNPFVDREQRFYDFIVYDGAELKMDWMTTPDIVYTRIDKVNPSDNEIDLSGSSDVGDSGYYIKKRLNHDAPPGVNTSGQNNVYFRYAEVLLNYAEAQNEAVGPDATVYDALNRIRNRSNLPDLQTGLNQAQMREEIRRERRVELCFEEKRYLDNKRWRTAEIVMNQPRHNMVIRNSSPDDNSGVWTYSIEAELDYASKFEVKQYMTPIPYEAIDQNKGMSQNPGY